MFKKITVFSMIIFSLLWSGVKLKFVTLAPESSSWGKCLSAISRDVYRASKRQIRIYVIYGGGGMDEEEMAKEIRYKRIDGGAFTGNGLGAICPEVRVLELPGLFHSYDEVDYVYQYIQDDLQIHFNRNNAQLVSLSETGWAYFFSEKPIKKIDDIRQTRMWLWEGDKLAYSIMKHFRIKAKSIKFTEVIPSFQTGMIDGFYCTPTAAIQLQWYKQIKYMLELRLSDVTGGLVFSKSSWENLTKEQQQMLVKISKKHLKTLTENNRRNDEESIRLLKQNNIKIIQPQQDMDKFSKMSKAVAADLSGKLFPESLYKKVLKLLKEYRTKN